jgi:hypothetical protein
LTLQSDSWFICKVDLCTKLKAKAGHLVFGTAQRCHRNQLKIYLFFLMRCLHILFYVTFSMRDWWYISLTTQTTKMTIFSIFFINEWS